MTANKVVQVAGLAFVAAFFEVYVAFFDSCLFVVMRKESGVSGLV